VNLGTVYRLTERSILNLTIRCDAILRRYASRPVTVCVRSETHTGYHGDLNETYPVGSIDEDSKRLIQTARESLDEAIKLCKPGALFRDLGRTIEPIAKKNGCAVVRTYCGHGIHELFHCAPYPPHYAKNKAIGTMKAGMVFTIEPMINLGHSWYEDHWPDKWTAVTVDGKRSAQFEETLLITDTGVEVLTAGQPRVFT